MDLSTVELTGVVTEITNAAKIAIPVALTILGIRKGISWLFGMIRGA